MAQLHWEDAGADALPKYEDKWHLLQEIIFASRNYTCFEKLYLMALTSHAMRWELATNTLVKFKKSCSSSSEAQAHA